MARDRREIEYRDDDFIPSSRLPHEAEHALLRIAAVDPLEAGRITIQLV